MVSAKRTAKVRKFIEINKGKPISVLLPYLTKKNPHKCGFIIEDEKRIISILLQHQLLLIVFSKLQLRP
jgi:hypothetical protein